MAYGGYYRLNTIFQGNILMAYEKPIIGITPSHNTENDDTSLRPTYPRAVRAAGGLPILLPLEGTDEDWKQLAAMCGGFLFSGGPDPHPFLFGDETHSACGNVSPARDSMEIRLLKAAMELKKPVFGICRGIQILNVALGGTIYQDIPNQVERSFPLAHRQPFHYTVPSHYVNIKKGSLLSKASGGLERISVNSQHHQAIKTPAPGLVPVGWASDGVIEAIEKPDYPFFLGVQWHPEYLWQNDPAAMGLFHLFVETCKTSQLTLHL